MIGSGVDFDSNPITVKFGVKDMSEQRVNVSVNCDNLLENDEQFDIALSLISNNSQATTRRSKSTGKITDSTGQ